MGELVIFDDFQKALSQFGDPNFRSVLLRSVAITIALLVAAGFGVLGFLNFVLPDTVSLPWIGSFDLSGGLLSGLSIVVFMVMSVFLMIPVATVFIGFFVEEIAEAVEQQHYPHLPEVPRVGLWASIVDSLQFLALLIVVNLIALIIYFASTLLAPVIFWLVNGLLLGREYFQLVAMRRIGLKAAKALRRKHFLSIWLAGTLMAIPLSIPVVNLLVPILGVATFTHQFHRLNKSK